MSLHHPQYGATRVSRGDYMDLCRRIEDDQRVKNKAVAVCGEDVLQLFLSSSEEVRDTESESVHNKNITFLYFSVRNSVMLELSEETCSALQPLSNLSLSVRLMEQLLSLLQSNQQLKSVFSDGNEREDFEFFAQTVRTSAEKKEEFITDTDNARDMIIFYHTFRNKVLTEMLSKLTGLVNLLQNIIVNTENSTDKTYNMSVTQLKTLIGLPWKQQVLAIEAMAFEFDFLEKFQSFWFQNILVQSFAGSHQEVEEQEETSAYKVPNRIARIHRCNFCSYSSKKMSNIKTHIKGKHRNLSLEPGESGFTTHFNPGGEWADSFPKSDEELTSHREDSRSPNVSKCVRVHQCNFCDYLSPKMSNIKTHLRGKHRNIEMEDIELGFTTHFKVNSVSKARKNVKKLKKDEADAEWNANDIKLEPEPDEVNIEYENEDVPSLEDFLDININVGSRTEKKRSRKKNNYQYDSDDSFINDDSDISDDDQALNPDDQSFQWNLEDMKEEVETDEFGKKKKIFEEAGRSFLYEMENHCHTCNANFSSCDNDKWRQHMFQHSAANPFECPFVGCEKAFTQEEDLNSHVITHSKEKPFVCSYEGCEKSFTRNWYLKVHMETCHPGEGREESGRRGRKVYLCDHCQTSTTVCADMKSHLRSAHPELCSGSGTEGYSVRSDERPATVAGNRLHQCRFCDYVTNKKSNIKQHVKGVHKNLDLESAEQGFTTLVKPEKKLDCPDCDYSTTTQSGLQRHAIIAHDKSDTPIKCDHCEFQSTSRKLLATHNKESHAAVKVFMCDQCDYSATREEYLRKHIKFHHDGERIEL